MEITAEILTATMKLGVFRVVKWKTAVYLPANPFIRAESHFAPQYVLGRIGCFVRYLMKYDTACLRHAA